MRNSLFNRFIILEEVGEGKSAKVYKAKDIKYNRLVAIKALLKSSLNTRHRIRRVECECSIMMNLSHPNILKLHYVLEDDQYLFLITPYAQGGDLLDYMLSNNPARIHEDEMRPLFFQIVSAMLYAHSKQICHRDLKPENILLTPDKKEVWVADWGFSERFSEETQLRERCGTTLYAPPEMFLGQPYRGPETDTWSLGVVLYAMRTGKFPFGGKTNEEIAMNVVGSVLRFPSDVSTRLKELITVMLAKRGSKRIRLHEVMDHPWLSPLNDPGSPLMISHKSFMQAGGSSCGDGERHRGERERTREREREDKKDGGEEESDGKGKEREDQKERDQKKQKEREEKENAEKERKDKEEREDKERKKDGEESANEGEKKKEADVASNQEEKKDEKKGNELEQEDGKSNEDEKEGGREKKKRDKKKEKEHKSHRSHTTNGEVKKEKGERRKKKDPKEDGEETTRKREKREKKRSKEKEEKKEEGGERKKERKSSKEKGEKGEKREKAEKGGKEEKGERGGKGGKGEKGEAERKKKSSKKKEGKEDEKKKKERKKMEQEKNDPVQ